MRQRSRSPKQIWNADIVFLSISVRDWREKSAVFLPMLLKAAKREKVGHGLKSQRDSGIIPAVVYGKSFDNLHINLELGTFKKIFSEAGHSSVIDLKIDNDQEPLKVLVADVQREPLSNEIIHADFHKVDLGQKVSTEVPVKITGESPAVKSGEAILLTLLPEIEVEALPLDLPHEITLDITGLEKIGEGVAVKDLPIDHTKVRVKEHQPDDLVVKLDYAVQIEKEEETKGVEEVEVLTEKKEDEEGAGAETETGQNEPPAKKEEEPKAKEKK
ncbi:MAG: 50S ribosomal protein L25 [Patescibacteria group bacterium]|nr:50S ribosomal protein L25 [Patescibacteria group bacterium]